MRKKLVSILCVMALVVSLAGCGGGGSDSGSDGGGAEATTAGDVSDSIVRYTLTELPQIDPGVTSDFGGATVLMRFAFTMLASAMSDQASKYVKRTLRSSKIGRAHV